MQSQLTAADIVKLLAQRHAKDVFVPECKNGPSQSGSHLRLDGWAMKKSWANLLVVGYEVKVSRSDFINDLKWHGYLPLCNQFYFVCPANVIRLEEVGSEAGLIYVSKAGTMLVTKKKAPYRDVTIPEKLFRYILMCRAKIGAERDPLDALRGRPSAARWREWLEEKGETRKLGYSVAKAIRQHVERVDKENAELRRKNKALDEVHEVLKRLGFTDRDREYISPAQVEHKLQMADKLFPPHFTKTLENFERQISQIRLELGKSLPKGAHALS